MKTLLTAFLLICVTAWPFHESLGVKSRTEESKSPGGLKRTYATFLGKPHFSQANPVAAPDQQVAVNIWDGRLRPLPHRKRRKLADPADAKHEGPPLPAATSNAQREQNLVHAAVDDKKANPVRQVVFQGVWFVKTLTPFLSYLELASVPCVNRFHRDAFSKEAAIHKQLHAVMSLKLPDCFISYYYNYKIDLPPIVFDAKCTPHHLISHTTTYMESKRSQNEHSCSRRLLITLPPELSDEFLAYFIQASSQSLGKSLSRIVLNGMTVQQLTAFEQWIAQGDNHKKCDLNKLHFAFPSVPADQWKNIILCFTRITALNSDEKQGGYISASGPSIDQAYALKDIDDYLRKYRFGGYFFRYGTEYSLRLKEK